MTTIIGQDINNTNIGFIILNQARDEMGSMFTQIKSTGGRALEHWSSLRLEVKKASQIKDKRPNAISGKEEERYIGHIFRIITQKSKVSTPNQKYEAYLISDPYVGLEFYENLYRSSVDHFNLISKGAWRKYDTLDGQEISLRDNEWVPFLKTEEGQPIAQELFNRQMVQVFPNGYVGFDNQNSDITQNPIYAKLKEYYNNLPEEQSETEEPNTEEDTDIYTDTGEGTS